MPKISVIVPVYNAEKTLDYCLSSIVNQTLKDIEIICVNDGSNDNSLEILKQYSYSDERIIIVDQANSGVSAARNRGLEVASGDYIMFCDSDDRYELTLCEKVENKIEETDADVICYAHQEIFQGEKYLSDLKFVEELNKKNIKDEITKRVGFQVYIWNKAFRKELITKNNIKFQKDLKNAEDMLFCCSVYFLNPTYAYIPEILYYYTKDGNGDTVWDNSKGIENDFKSYKYLTLLNAFKKQSLETKLALTKLYISGSVQYYRHFQGDKIAKDLINDIKLYLAYVVTILPKKECNKIKAYKKLKKFIWKSEKHWYFNIYNVETSQFSKTFTILGKKIVVKRKNIINRQS